MAESIDDVVLEVNQLQVQAVQLSEEVASLKGQSRHSLIEKLMDVLVNAQSLHDCLLDLYKRVLVAIDDEIE